MTFAALLVSAGTGLTQTNSADDLARRAVERRAVEAINWGMSAVNFDLLCQSMVKVGGGPNQVVYWSRLPDWKNQTLTPNPDTVYLFPFINTKAAGPVVIEIPPAEGGSITGTIMDAWQGPLEDVGPAGVDQGRGGKYLVLPPHYSEAVPDGYVVLASSTYQGWAGLRSNIASGSDADVAKAVAYGKRVKVYPLSQAANPPSTVFVDAIDVVFDNIIPYDLRFFQALDRFVQYEPWLPRDIAMIDVLKSLGIEKGKPFAPDANTQAALKAGAREAQAWLEARYEAGFPPYYPDARWTLPASHEISDTQAAFWQKLNGYAVDARGLLYSYGYASIKHLGVGQFYLITIRDKQGRFLDGGRTYRVNVPPNVPVKLYWSATDYDRLTHTFIRDQKTLSRSSLSPGLQKNPDGSVDLYFGPKAPTGHENNWVPTNPGGRFEVFFRLYGPEKPLFDKTWRLSDIEEVKS
ncbi:MAG: DUF1254 domain-containing protein [Xanthobacteraceae bacterium]|nr:DUF1254 domain-containing protein [Xanthobacteraceae bacterium]